MKNFMNRIECIIEPNILYSNDGVSTAVTIDIRCKSLDGEVGFNKIVSTDFMVSYFDVIFDDMKEILKEEFLKEVDKES